MPTAEWPNRTSNGLLLHADLHKLFDSGYLTITPNYHIEVSSRIKEEFQNGGAYYRFNGRALKVLPQALQEQLEKGFVEWDDYRGLCGVRGGLTSRNDETQIIRITHRLSTSNEELQAMSYLETLLINIKQRPD